MMEKKSQSHSRGILAEGVAELFLRAKGYSILDRRYKTKVGEVDIVAMDGDVLVFVEVKARPTLDEALFSITPKMKTRITDAAMSFLGGNPKYTSYAMRFDVVAIKLPFTIRHMENAFLE